MSFSVFVNFNGNCREAVMFYATVFNQAMPVFFTYGEVDTSFDPNVQMSEEGKKLVMDTSLSIMGTTVGFSDMPDNFEFIRGNSMMLAITCSSF